MAANLSSSQHPLRLCIPSSSAKSLSSKKLHSSEATKLLRPGAWKRAGVLSLRCRTAGVFAIRCWRSQDQDGVRDGSDRPPFDLNLAVVLAGFAFEAYASPPKNVGMRETDAADCQTVFLSESFLREVYDGQLFIKLKKGSDFPAMDPWGTSDPYVVMNLEGQVAKSKIKWGTKEPTWNEDFTLNIRKYPTKLLQIAAWDANLVTPHKRMGNAGIDLESLCDGAVHELVVELEGIGGGGKVQLEEHGIDKYFAIKQLSTEINITLYDIDALHYFLVLLQVKYKSFDEIDKEKQGWNIPFVSDFLVKNSLGSALKMVLGSESINAHQFVQSTFGQLKSLNYAFFMKDQSSDSISPEIQDSVEYANGEMIDGSEAFLKHENSPSLKDNNLKELEFDNPRSNSPIEKEFYESPQSDEFFWKKFAGIINQNVLQRLGFSFPENVGWGGFDLLNRMSWQSQRIAEQEYIESGLATPERKDNAESDCEKSPSSNDATQPSFMDVRKASWDVLSQTETILGALMVLTATFSQERKNTSPGDDNMDANDDLGREAEMVDSFSMNGTGNMTLEGPTLDKKRSEEIQALFSTAESAMEAWAMLATSLGRPSFIKSEFDKICFLDNVATDTQVAVWRDSARRRLVVAFRGTEQAKWKDLLTDLMLVPSGLNPERIGGNFRQEVQVHSGFLNAYDSVRNRILTLIKLSIGFSEDADLEAITKWHVYVTGHSLGGALATLLALELSSSRMAKCGAIYITMYNFGSPRVGNKHFAEVYNEKVKDSWRLVNHRDIIPTVPRLMGYCHVAQPVYLAAGDLKNALVNLESLRDEFHGDIIGESTPDVLVSEFMRGEKQLIEKILQTEIKLFRSIRDGTALMQHMEDFYYITLLECVRSAYKGGEGSTSNETSSSLST